MNDELSEGAMTGSGEPHSPNDDEPCPWEMPGATRRDPDPHRGPWLILLAAGAAGVAIWLGTGHGNTNTGGGVIVVSPTR